MSAEKQAILDALERLEAGEDTEDDLQPPPRTGLRRRSSLDAKKPQESFVYACYECGVQFRTKFQRPFGGAFCGPNCETIHLEILLERLNALNPDHLARLAQEMADSVLALRKERDPEASKRLWEGLKNNAKKVRPTP